MANVETLMLGSKRAGSGSADLLSDRFTSSIAIAQNL